MRPIHGTEYIFSDERVSKILSAVKIGESITSSQRKHIENLIREFADTFALSLSEVKPNQHTEHHINVPPDARLPRTERKPTQPLTPS
ncbi:hypothetical protein M422DRAFT_161820 [Sphaerobolus stellatus SS14]|nr:hypothetical protein M422DRAFT_161820 [Sphaerobolus stellatus SS14]